MEEEESKLNQLLDNNEEIDLTLSYSKLSDFDRNGPISLIRRKEIDTAGVKHGSLTDDLLVDSMTGSTLFEEGYYRFDGEKPSATLGELCDVICKNYIEKPDVETILEIIKLNEFWSRTKDPDKIKANFDNKDFWSYIDAMYEKGDKNIVTTQEYNDAIEAVSILKTHDYSKDILINNFENIYQYRFSFDHKGFKMRGILDLITIDHDSKTVTFTDLKTGKGSAAEFEDSFIKWRYYFQAGIYIRAFEYIMQELGLAGYTLNKFQFLYISKTEKIPFVYVVTDKWIKASFDGFKIGRYRFKGIDELIDNIYWCWKNKEYIVPQYIVENNGIINLKDDFIELNE
jgi:hypothetical protein